MRFIVHKRYYCNYLWLNSRGKIATSAGGTKGTYREHSKEIKRHIVKEQKRHTRIGHIVKGQKWHIEKAKTKHVVNREKEQKLKNKLEHVVKAKKQYKVKEHMIKWKKKYMEISKESLWYNCYICEDCTLISFTIIPELTLCQRIAKLTYKPELTYKLG